MHGPVIAALARTATGDIERAAEALKGAERWRIHTFISTSDVQMGAMLQDVATTQVLQAIEENVKLAKSYTEDVEFSAQDATRTELEFLLECFRLAVRCGATTINVPDTVGYATPTEFGELIRIVREDAPDDVDHLDALPQRPRAGGRELAGRHRERRPAGRGGGQRDRRARGQLLARGDRDDRAHAPRAPRRAARPQHQGDRADLAAGRA